MLCRSRLPAPNIRPASPPFCTGCASWAWIDGRNIQIEYRAGTGSPEEIRKHATELVGLGPDVILATGVSTVGPLKQVTSAVPIVFAVVPDPVGAGIVDSLARPGGNVTGFSTYEYG